MIKNMGLTTKIILGSSVTIILMVALGFVAINANKSLTTANHWVDHTHKVIATANSIVASGVDMETGMRGYLLAGKEEFLDPYNGGRDKFYQLVAGLSETVNDNPAQVQLLAEIKANIDAWQKDVTEPTIELRRRIGDAETMNDMGALVGEARGKVFFDKFRGQMAEFISREEKLMHERQAKAEEAVKFNEKHAKEINTCNNWVRHTDYVIAQANKIIGGAVDMETGMRGFLLAGKEEFLEPYKAGQKHFDELIASLSETVNDNPAQVRLLKEMDETHDGWQKTVTEPMIELRRQVASGYTTMDDMAREVAKAKGKAYVDTLRGQVATFIEREEKLKVKRLADVGRVTEAAEKNRELITETNKWVTHTRNVIATANDIIAAAVNMETGMRGYLLAGREAFLDPYKAGMKKFDDLVAGLSRTVNDNPAQVKLLTEVKANIKAWQKDVTEPQIALRRKIGNAKTMDDMADLIAEARGKQYFDKFRSQVGTFIDRESKLMAQRKAEADKTAKNSVTLIGGGILLAIVLGFLISMFLARSITRPFKAIFQGLKSFSNGELDSVKTRFREVIDALISSSTQVSEASGQIASGSSQQAASIEETSSSMEEIASMTKTNAANAEQANTLMTDAKRVVETANASMNELIQSMDDISKASEETSKIVKTIDEIAFQTNLLALNAAVEAARAGEAGAGFAVVADEVRNLAMRAAEAAKDTSSLIEGTVKNVNEGAELVERTNQAFTDVTESTAKVGALVAEISSASQEQSDGINQVTTAMSDMDTVVQQNAAGSEELSSQAGELNAKVGVLIEIVEGRKSGHNGAHTNGNGSSSGYARPLPGKAGAKTALPQTTGEIRPEQVIPLDDDDEQNFKDF